MQNTAPVTREDFVSVPGVSSLAGRHYGQAAFVLHNDRDPEGDPLRVCRYDTPPADLRVSLSYDEQYFLVSSYRNVNRSYEFVYYACDGELETPSFVNVVVHKIPEVQVTTTKRPGVLRFRDKGVYGLQVSFDNLRRPEANKFRRYVEIPARGTRFVRVSRPNIEYSAITPSPHYYPAGSGVIRDVEVRARD